MTHLLQGVVGQEIWLDPTEVESKIASGSTIIACMPALGTITSVWQSGRLPPEQVIKVDTHSLYIVV